MVANALCAVAVTEIYGGMEYKELKSLRAIHRLIQGIGMLISERLRSPL